MRPWKFCPYGYETTEVQRRIPGAPINAYGICMAALHIDPAKPVYTTLHTLKPFRMRRTVFSQWAQTETTKKLIHELMKTSRGLRPLLF